MSEDMKHKVKYVKPEAKDLGPVGPILGLYPCQNGNSNVAGGCGSGNQNASGDCIDKGNSAGAGCTMGKGNSVACNNGPQFVASYRSPRF
jgi:hypothetical protein